jgi:hypothetical protein
MKVSSNMFQLESQKIISSLMVSSGFVSGFIIILTVLFLAPWSDASGRRKPLMLISISGMAIGTLALLTAELFFPYLSAEWVLYMNMIPISMGGYFTILFLASNSYLGDVSIFLQSHLNLNNKIIFRSAIQLIDV